MSASSLIEAAVAVVTTSIAAAAFFQATKANRSQSQAAVTAIDAAAYERAKSLYESAIDTLNDQTTHLHDQVVNLQTEVSRLRSQSADLQSEVTRLRVSNTDLKEQLAILKRRRPGN